MLPPLLVETCVQPSRAPDACPRSGSRRSRVTEQHVTAEAPAWGGRRIGTLELLSMFRLWLARTWKRWLTTGDGDLGSQVGAIDVYRPDHPLPRADRIRAATQGVCETIIRNPRFGTLIPCIGARGRKVATDLGSACGLCARPWAAMNRIQEPIPTGRRRQRGRFCCEAVFR
jgi:hypothetical protein